MMEKDTASCNCRSLYICLLELSLYLLSKPSNILTECIVRVKETKHPREPSMMSLSYVHWVATPVSGINERNDNALFKLCFIGQREGFS
jgi:hypothetical protein